MCSHYQAEKRRALLERRFGALPPKGLKSAAEQSHVYPTQFAPIIRRPAERDSGDKAVPDFEMVEARFGLLPTFAKDVKYGTRKYNARSETAASEQHARSLHASEDAGLLVNLNKECGICSACTNGRPESVHQDPALPTTVSAKAPRHQTVHRFSES